MPDAGSTKIVHGFYRYTDIWFEWNKALPRIEDGYALKAIISHDALVHPDNPLRLAGKPGIELTIGTLETGEARLLFSSAQVEYIRYWLHTMGLTRELIPLPYSECLLTASRLQNHSPVVYKTGSELRAAIKVIDKNNKKLKGTDSNLSARRNMFERIRSLWSEKRGVWCAVDFEAWDLDHRVITEFGWSTVRWVDGEAVEDTGHLVVAKHRHFTNHYVPENRRFYHYGESEDVTMGQMRERIHSMLESGLKDGPLFLVFHDNYQDLKYLRSPEIEAPLEGLSYFLPESCAEAAVCDPPKVYVVDTSELFAALEGDSGGQKRSLERVCRLLQIKWELTQHLHNAGNDAHCTQLALREMAGGDPLDMQRASRWPQHESSGNGVRVKFSKEEEDSDAMPTDDEDDITAGPYNPRTGKLRENWSERVDKLQQKLGGIAVEQDGNAGGANDQAAEKSAPSQGNQ
ncbi:hypothetical protein BC834DRAFT_683755 [Gloeopeniophorella convolvens]|nr:hypothetical protein BC834DRAFT_683755 [Gloeopeniophorella convolvens]